MSTLIYYHFYFIFQIFLPEVLIEIKSTNNVTKGDVLPLNRFVKDFTGFKRIGSGLIWKQTRVIYSGKRTLRSFT